MVAVARRHSCTLPGLTKQPDLGRAICGSSAQGRATVKTATAFACGQWLPGAAVDGGVVAQGIAGEGVEEALWFERCVVSNREAHLPKTGMSAIIAACLLKLTGPTRVMRWKSE